MLPLHASELAGALGVPSVSVALISMSWPSRSTTAHHIFVFLPAPRSADGVAAAVVLQAPKSAVGLSCASELLLADKISDTVIIPESKKILLMANLPSSVDCDQRF